MENDVQRYIQVRDEIQDEIKKIGPSVERLHEITKRFIAHFDVFKEMSSQTGNIIASEIKNASQEMAQRVAAEFLDRIETIPQEAVSRLNQSIAHADRQLKQVKSSNFKRNILTLVISHLFILSIGFGAGYLYNKRT
ncbi:MAG: hypothetical protein HOI80_05255, partial [Alphaproteobacteria bacterium]|nr:hypothetical protein [Alphaproteobacteria bacterium]